MLIFDKTYEATIDVIRLIHADLRLCLDRLKYSATDQDRFYIGSSEILTNAIKHTHVKPTSFKVSIRVQDMHLRFILMDNGEVFTEFSSMLQTSQERHARMQAGDLEVGGLGLFLAGQYFDTFTYDHTDGWNCYNLSTSSPFAEQQSLVLIIDDDAAQRDLLSLYIADHYQVGQAESGKSALEWLKTNDAKPDLILCDVMMRDGDGVEFCKILQDNKDLALIPFIFMTGKPDTQIAQIAEDLPVNNFLKKPIQKDILVKTIKRILGKTAQDQKIIGDRLDDAMTSTLAPALPEKIGAYQSLLKWQAAEAGGGDIVLHLSGEKCEHIIVIDVMGHGAQAKFFSHSFVGYLRGFLSAQHHTQDPGEILTALSQFLYHDKIGEQTILTAQIVTFSDDNTLRIASAGHPAPLLQDGHGLHKIDIEGAVPGLTLDTLYQSVPVVLHPQNRLILYTDGLMEVGTDSTMMQKFEEDLITQIKTQYDVDLAQATTHIWDYFLACTSHRLHDDALLIMLQKD